MYKNLKAEMIKQDVTEVDIAKTINKAPDTVKRKINGKMRITVEEAKLISSLFKVNNSISYLFFKEN